MLETDQIHKPVMLNEVLTELRAEQQGLYVDGTFGAGGYSKAILQAHPQNQLYAFDRDQNVESLAKALHQEFSPRFHFINERFSQIVEQLQQKQITKLDGLVVDLGVSSMQLDQAERGFSFQQEAHLDMRMGKNELSAFEVVNNYNETELADIIYNFGEEHSSRKIAHYIVKARAEQPINSTLELARLVARAKGQKNIPGKIHPATKTFQALRIFINDELGELRKFLQAALSLLKSGGRLVVVSFHGLEDKIVKNFIKEYGSVSTANNRYLPEITASAKEVLLTKGRKLKASKAEVSANPRSRSAILRSALKK